MQNRLGLRGGSIGESASRQAGRAKVRGRSRAEYLEQHSCSSGPSEPPSVPGLRRPGQETRSPDSYRHMLLLEHVHAPTGTAENGMGWYGLVWSGLAWFGLVWSGLACS